jgi:hypothetical protein
MAKSAEGDPVYADILSAMIFWRGVSVHDASVCPLAVPLEPSLDRLGLDFRRRGARDRF